MHEVVNQTAQHSEFHVFDARRGRTSWDTIAAVPVKPMMVAETGGSVDASKGGELRSADLVDLVGFRVREA